jgi:hypothetical protein
MKTTPILAFFVSCVSAISPGQRSDEDNDDYDYDEALTLTTFTTVTTCPLTSTYTDEES